MLIIEERIRITGVLDSLGLRWENESSNGNEEEASRLLSHYHYLVLWLMSTGFNDYLPDGVELPDEFMPTEYLDMIKSVSV